MLGTHQHTFTAILEKIQRILLLKVEYLKLETLEKGSNFLGMMLLIIAGLIFGSFALLCLSFAFAYLLGGLLHNFVWAFLIVASIYLFLILILIIWKDALLINPMMRVLHKSLFKNSNEFPHEK